MTKKEIAVIVVNKIKIDISKKDIIEVINILFEVMKDELLSNNKITIDGFFTLDAKIVESKTGISFGKKWETPSKYVPIIKFSDKFKQQLSGIKIK